MYTTEHKDTAPSGWQPIETCPKDGTPFLAYALCGGYQSSDFRKGSNPYQSRWAIVLAGWSASNNAVSINGVTSGEFNGATHWMPLPPLPKD